MLFTVALESGGRMECSCAHFYLRAARADDAVPASSNFLILPWQKLSALTAQNIWYHQELTESDCRR
jgi:hypothetical protein